MRKFLLSLAFILLTITSFSQLTLFGNAYYFFTAYNDGTELIWGEYPDTYEEDMFPMIEVNYDIWSKLEGIFGEKMVTEFLLKWINSRYDLNAVSVNAG